MVLSSIHLTLETLHLAWMSVTPWGLAFICLSESNVNWNLTYLQGKVSNTVHNIWETSSLQHLQHPERYLHQCQCGGSLQIITDRWVSHIRSKGMGPYSLGHWSYLILQGKGDRSVAIITAYWSCKSTFDSTGHTTSYMQQYFSLLQYNTSLGHRSTPDPHCQFVLNLQAWISKLHSDNISIILSLDSNKDTMDRKGNFYPLEFQEGVFPHAPNHNGSMATLVARCGLLDVLSHFHPPPPTPLHMLGGKTGWTIYIYVRWHYPLSLMLWYLAHLLCLYWWSQCMLCWHWCHLTLLWRHLPNCCHSGRLPIYLCRWFIFQGASTGQSCLGVHHSTT